MVRELVRGNQTKGFCRGFGEQKMYMFKLIDNDCILMSMIMAIMVISVND